MLFSRYEDGSKPVKPLPQGGWEVLNLDGTPGGTYTTARGLLAALTGHPTGRNWTFDRYFKRASEATPLDGGIFDLLAIPSPGISLPLLHTTPGISLPRESPPILADPVSRTPTENLRRVFPGPSILGGQKLGIDLQNRAHEVRKLLFAGFGRRMYLSGYDPEDVLQEVYKGILVRNEGTCPWDPKKSSFGHYVHMVCSCVLSNYHRKQHRTHQMEQLGLNTPSGEDGDVASNSTIAATDALVHTTSLLSETAQDLVAYLRCYVDAQEAELASQVLPLLVAETPRVEMQKRLKVSAATLTRVIGVLRTHAPTWRNRFLN